jgi:hypothetical protein
VCTSLIIDAKETTKIKIIVIANGNSFADLIFRILRTGCAQSLKKIVSGFIRALRNGITIPILKISAKAAKKINPKNIFD